jgi:lipid II:glycine glycyltransferase (peptidoglycan interpeptide bridge formation enzyme)
MSAYLLYNNILETLAREGNLSFDLGRIPPSNNETDQVYHFKKSYERRKIPIQWRMGIL